MLAIKPIWYFSQSNCYTPQSLFQPFLLLLQAEMRNISRSTNEQLLSINLKLKAYEKIFTLIAAALMAVNVSAANKVLKITGTADKVNAWDSQCYINLKNLEKGKPYVVKFDVYTTAGTEFKIGTEAIDETQTEHMTEWNASAVFSYTEELTLTNRSQRQ